MVAIYMRVACTAVASVEAAKGVFDARGFAEFPLFLSRAGLRFLRQVTFCFSSPTPLSLLFSLPPSPCSLLPAPLRSRRFFTAHAVCVPRQRYDEVYSSMHADVDGEWVMNLHQLLPSQPV